MEVGDLKAKMIDVRKLERAESLVLQIDDLFAVQAYEMMVMVRIPIEPRNRTGMADLGDETETDQQVEYPVYRRPRDAWNAILNPIVYLIRGGVVTASKHVLENGPALDGHRKPLLAAEFFKPLQGLLVVGVLRIHAKW